MTVKSSPRAVLLIVTEEDGDENYYLKTEEHFDWPGGASGPTVGVGFDCGYESADSIQASWAGYIDQARIDVLKTAAGKHGEAGRVFVDAHKSAVTISWTESLAQFQGHELPRWEDITAKALPNVDALSGDSFGALVSLTYNRGPSFDSPGSRYIEMRNIKSHMAAKAFDLVPNEFLAMRRLWPKGGDLWNRRGHEAMLFRDGLLTPQMASSEAKPATG